VRLETPTLAPGQATWGLLQIYTPAGGLYQTKHVPFSTDPTLKQVASKDGVDHPIDVIPAAVITGGYGLDFVVLVGGTNFIRHPQPGMWKFSVTLDDVPIKAEKVVTLSTVMP